MKVILYGSKYGTTKAYAKELSVQSGIPFMSYDEVEDINAYDTIVYLGGLYAGGVLGMKKTFLDLSGCEGKRIIIATVGLADPMDLENVRNIRNHMKKQLSDEIYQKADIFHLRGGIDYAKLSFKHKTMMAMLYQKAKSLPAEKKNSEVKAMIDSYNKQVSFLDFDRLKDILELMERKA